jgi:hypothetical protein
VEVSAIDEFAVIALNPIVDILDYLDFLPSLKSARAYNR